MKKYPPKVAEAMAEMKCIVAILDIVPLEELEVRVPLATRFHDIEDAVRRLYN